MTIHAMKPTVSAVVLAGGASLRMGCDKASIVLGGLTLLQRSIDVVSPLAAEVLVGCRAGRPDPAAYQGRNVRLVSDVVGEGPLAGIAAALRGAANDWLLVVPVDMPDLRTDVLGRLPAAIADPGGPGSNVSAVVFRLDDVLLPLPLLVNRRTLPVLTAQLERADYRVLHFLQAIDVVEVPLDPSEAADFARNANTPDDLADAVGPGS